MKAIVCEQIEQFKWIELEEPAFEPGEAVVRIKRIGICGTDLHAFKGNQPYFTYPRILGHELSGIIERIGDNEAGLREGDRVSVIPYLHCGACIACRNGKTNCCTQMRVLGVHTDGGMRERMSVPVTHLISANDLTLDQAAVIEPLSIGAHAVRRSELKPGETALVIGAGPIGLGVMAMAKQRGARVIAMDMNEERLAFCQRWAKVDHTVHALRDPKARLEGLNAGDLPTVVFDATGNAGSMAGAFDYAAHGGKLVYVGLVKGDIAFSDPDFHKRELTLLASRNATKEDFLHVLDVVKSGAIDVGGYISHRAPFDEMIARFDSWLRPETNVIKAMVEL
ncbi:2-desacetyl-2-hydroxyethyl bacteriochlorophyllide A dehydrogenase [Paenibacillus sp. UNC496MF]|uniref:zinc-binding alcohol dehydrogenase family protein n=1 Tax=Paenibacillus sp. UNC496MF TaxID=1502753 RepID=UPI0008E5B7FD|nr:zinc-binding alcohol dehydrogenase family protein [Paenibacillus sp. UNC496MF]SFI69376.1 2-desacetyl-2-hydroxyethyl bacteriochlorophyllide A dehydrogenase [Paenibacillus sp. UNC496MF]